MSEDRVLVTVDGHKFTLSNLGKVLYPRAGFTKGEVIDYYTRIAPVLLPHLRGRPLTLKRYPNGVHAQSFFEKNAPSHTPEWVRSVELPAPGSTKDRETVNYLVCDEVATLVWVANLAALELHIPQWTVGPRGAPHGADQLVLDLDPGEPAGIAECCEVACLLRDLIETDGLTGYAKTSGRKGMQLYAPLAPTDADRMSRYARELARRLETARPELVVSRMTKKLREGKVLVDWSQNNAAKTTVAVYSLRALERPTVSTPLTWDEVESAAPPRPSAGGVLDRVAQYGDLFAGLREPGPRLPT